jgi:hypothetical protein
MPVRIRKDETVLAACRSRSGPQTYLPHTFYSCNFYFILKDYGATKQTSFPVPRLDLLYPGTFTGDSVWKCVPGI